MKLTVNVGDLVAAVVAVISFVGGFIAATRRVGKPLLDMAKEWREFRGDWYGVQPRPGFPGHPGMAERVAQTEQDIGSIKRELQTNGGTSLRDEVRRMALQLRVTSQHSGAPVLPPPPEPNHEQATPQGVAA